jgi:CheY-like chemotaxis protein
VFDEQGRFVEMLSVGTDITRLKAVEAALREADRRKDEFLATLAHELRNPLAPIRTGVDLLLQRHDDAATAKQVLPMMDRQLTHLVRLVDDLLDVSRVSRGKITLHKEHVDLADVVEAALEMSETEIARSKRHLTVSLPPEPLSVEGDRVRLAQVIANLLNNAAKFSGEDGRIRVLAERRSEQVQLRVRDDGIGIAPERLPEVFELFSQVQDGRWGGLGIGLTLVRRLVEMHGGSVSARSDGPGQGAEFTVSLPLARNAAVPTGASAATQPDFPPGRRVLVVDDNPDIADSLCQLLTLLDAEVRVAHDGPEAIRICAGWLPTHVLMDLGMPGMDGYETARRLCADHPERSFRLIAISGWAQDEHRKRAREAGFDRHLVKPVPVADLKAVLSD